MSLYDFWVRRIRYLEDTDEIMFECKAHLRMTEISVHVPCTQKYLQEHSFLTVYNYLGDQVRRYFNENY